MEEIEKAFKKKTEGTPYPSPEKVPKTEVEESYNMPNEKKPLTKEESDIAMRTAYYKNLEKQGDIPKTEPEVDKEPEPEPEPTPKAKETPKTPPTPFDKNIEDRMLVMEMAIKAQNAEISLMKNTIIEKDGQIEALSRGNTDLILIDMQTLAEDANDFKNTMLSIGTEEQLKTVLHDYKNYGVDMAYKRLMRYWEDNRASARQAIPLLIAIMVTMNKFNEKIKYVEEA